MDEIQAIDNHFPTESIFYILRLYTINLNTYEIDFANLVTFVHRCLDKDQQNEALREYSRHTEQRLREDLELLSEESRCKLQYIEGSISTIYFTHFFIEKISKAYKKIATDLDQAFPIEETLKITIPQHLVQVVNIQTDFLNLLSSSKPDSLQIIRLLFPELIKPILTTSEILKETLLDYAVLKVKLYLDKKKNAGYIENKIFPIFRQQSRSLKEMISNISLKTSQTIASIKDPTDFSFRFWAHFANLILQEFKQKIELLPNEHDYCQAAYLIYYFNVYHKGIQQKEREKQTALKHFERRIKRIPYVFSLTDIYNFTDNNGYLLLKKYSREYINTIIENKVQPEDPSSLPEIIRFITSHGQDYYIHKTVVMTYCLKMIFDASREIRKEYINEWIELLREHRKNMIMQDELKFIQDLNNRVQLGYPILAALLNNYYLLFLANEEYPPLGTSTAHIFDHTSKSLQPMNILLGIDRQEMIEEAKSYLPFWQTIPIFQWIILFFRRLFFGRHTHSTREQEQTQIRVNAKYSAPYSPNDFEDLNRHTSLADNAGAGIGTDPSLIPKLRANYKKAIQQLKDHFLGTNETFHSKLEFLAERWNPLFDPVAQNNLVEDVNSMIRDYLRSMKRGFRVKPPDVQRVEVLASSLAKNKHFDEIKKKNYLQLYIELYIVKELGENRF